MKTYILFLMTSCITWSVNAQTNQLPDTSKHHGHDLSSSINISPEYPGGIRAFYKLLERNLKYPPVAQLLGLNGRVVVSFIIEKDGTVNDARPVNCLGAGCESEAVRIISMSKQWIPGKQNGRDVRVQYSIPIDFNIGKKKVFLTDLRNSPYGFVFEIDGTDYTIDEVKPIIGKSFPSERIKAVETYYDTTKYAMGDKKAIYLVIL